MQYWLSKHKQKVINKFILYNFGRFSENLVKSKLRHENNKVKGLAVTCGFGRGRRVFSSWEKKKLSILLIRKVLYFKKKKQNHESQQQEQKMTAKNPVKSLNAASSAAWMERLRAKAALYRSATDLSKATRTTLLDRRQAPDAKDRVDLRASLDQLANAVPARNASSLADRLEAISKQVASR